MKLYPRHALRLVILALLVLHAVSPVFPQGTATAPDPVVYLNPQQADHFQIALLALSHQSGIVCVAEGGPLHPTLPLRDAPTVARGGEPLSVVVARVATAYDYDVQREDGAFVLRKRYTDPDDLPDVTLAECAAALKDAQQIIGALNPNLEYAQYDNSPVRDLLTSLTPEQLQAMHDKMEDAWAASKKAKTPDEMAAAAQNVWKACVETRGLPISTLTPEQREAVRQIILIVQVQLPIVTSGLDLAPLREAARNDPNFCWREDHEHLREFGYEVPVGVSAKIFIRLAAPKRIVYNADGSISLGPGAAVRYSGAQAPHVAPKVVISPAPSDPLPGASVPPDPEGSASLAEVVAALNARAGGGATMAVDAALAPKRVTVVGGDALPPATLLQVLADVYGLRVRTKSDRSLLLTRKRQQTPLDYAAMIADLQDALPVPLARAALRQKERERLDARFSKPQPYWDLGENLTLKPPPSLKNSALRALRTAAEPRMKVAKDGHVALSALPHRADAALAVVLAAEPVTDLSSQINRGVPELFTHFDDLCLIGDTYSEGGQKGFSLQIALPNPSTTDGLKRLTTISNIPFTPPAPGGD